MSGMDKSRVFVGHTDSKSNAEMFIGVKSFDGWKVLVPPFVSKQMLVDSGEETTTPVDTEWTFVLHRL